MGLFRDLGKKAESLKREVERAAAEEASHVCDDCGETLYSAHETCPECGSDRILELTE